MKVIEIALAGDYAETTTTICACLKVTRTDDLVVGFTELDRPLTIDGVEYLPGFSLSSLASTDTLSVDNMEMTILPDDDLPSADLIAGLWDNAAFEIFEVNYAVVDESPDNGINVLKRGTTGEVRIEQSKFTIELRSLTQALQQTQGAVTQKNCRARLGSTTGPFKCMKDLTAFTFTGTVTSVTDNRIFADSARAEAPDYFAEGIIEFTSGLNDGRRQKIKIFWQADSPPSGEFRLSLPMPFEVQVGDTYTAIAGCDKTLATCKAKFDNVLNFQGEPHLPGVDELSKRGGAATQAAGDGPTLPAEDLSGSGDGPGEGGGDGDGDGGGDGGGE